MKIPRFIILLPWLFCAACSSNSTPEKAVTTAPPARKTLTQRMNENNGYKQDAEGDWKPQNDRRSEFESKGESHFAGKNFEKKNYRAGDYAKKSWWGNKEYGRKNYSGNTDGARFQKSSALQGQNAREAGSSARIPDTYQTEPYETPAARESGTGSIAKSSNAVVDKRRKVFQQPEIMDWREQRSLSVDQSKGILGR